MTVGILAVQGAFAEHGAAWDRLGEGHFEIRKPSDLRKGMDGLIIPGGESTVMGKLLADMGMAGELRERILAGLPVFGTCAGMILLAERIENGPGRSLATFPATVRRNAFGRQLGSFAAVSCFAGLGEIPMEFIRAPVIAEAGDGVDILSEVGGKAVAARYGDQLVTAFHPELTACDAVHRYFLDMF
jgi:pyridoxal 5'-phosphate synthase pdxT subunit